MVAKVNSGKSMSRILNYNEHKVKEGIAECIHASGFIQNADRLKFKDKLEGFTTLTRMNTRAKTNAIHITLNFDIGENLEQKKLIDIANLYMNKIGFGDQPYLVYQHFDAGHSHIHIVSTNIKYGGERISIHNIGRNQSELARKEIEKLFGLVQAESKSKQKDLIPTLKIEKALYGKSPTKQSISKVVAAVVRSYKYTSLPELNAALNQFNVLAYQGKEGSFIKDKKGLLYIMLDSKGNRIGVPIKASAIYGKPTLAKLEKQFKLNEVLRLPFKNYVKDKVEVSLHENPKLKDFVTALEKNNIKTVFRKNEEGRIYGITFVDNQNRVVFNGSDLGKQYSAKAITDRLTEIPKEGSISQALASTSTQELFSYSNETEGKSSFEIADVLKDLTTAELDKHGVDPLLRRKRRKKRKGRSI
jgi:hypothetical protein